jgi:hypothetical protein
MSEHYPKGAAWVKVWCKKCNKETAHRVDDGRRGPCLVCLEKLASRPPPQPKPPEQGNLF